MHILTEDVLLAALVVLACRALIFFYGFDPTLDVDPPFWWVTGLYLLLFAPLAVLSFCAWSPVAGVLFGLYAAGLALETLYLLARKSKHRRFGITF